MNLREQLIRDERCVLRVYNDSLGVPTIGVGRNLRDKGLSQHEADILLDNDILEVSAAVTSNLPWTMGLDEPRRAVLLNMAFNMGLGGLMEFTKTLAHVEAGEFHEASLEMLRSTWATQVGDRAVRLSIQMRTGEWQ